MAKKINSLLHVTHNDSDAVGCALVEEFIFPTKTLDKKSRIYVAAGAANADKVILSELFQVKFSYIEEAREYIRSEKEEHDYRCQHAYDMLLISDHDISKEMADFLNEYMESMRNTENEFQVFLVDHHSHALINELQDKYDWVYVTHYTHESACSFMLSKYVKSVLYEYSHIDEDFFKGFPEFKCLSILVRLIAFYDTFTYKDEPEVYNRFLEIFKGTPNIYGAEYIANVIRYKNFVSDVVDDLIDYYFQYFEFNNDGIKYKSAYGGEFISTKIMPQDFTYINRSIVPTVYKKYLSDIEKKAKVINFHAFGQQHNCVVFLSCRGDNISDACYDIINSHPAISMAMVIFPESKEISLRSNGSIDVSKIAYSLKGGGHPKAAGFHANNETMLYLIDVYYRGEDLSKYAVI